MITFTAECPCGENVRITFKRQRVKGRLCGCGRWIQITRNDKTAKAAAYVENDAHGEPVTVRATSGESTVDFEVERLR